MAEIRKNGLSAACRAAGLVTLLVAAALTLAPPPISHAATRRAAKPAARTCTTHPRKGKPKKVKCPKRRKAARRGKATPAPRKLSSTPARAGSTTTKAKPSPTSTSRSGTSSSSLSGTTSTPYPQTGAGSTPSGAVTTPGGSATETGPSVPAGPSAWEEPALVNPITVQLSDSNRNLKLSQTQDYILQCPPGPMPLTWALVVWGGHNVVLENCDIDVTVPNWAAQFKNQTGTLWVDDVHFGGVALTGGVQLQEPGATVVMRDVLFDTVYGSLQTNHAECIQTWSGPDRLLIDGLTCTTTYQGLFLLPDQYGGAAPTVFDLRNIDIDDSQGAVAMWLGDVTGSPSAQANQAIPDWNVQNVSVVPNPARTWPGWWLYPNPANDPTWAGVTAAAEGTTPYVQATANGASGVDQTGDPRAIANEQP